LLSKYHNPNKSILEYDDLVFYLDRDNGMKLSSSERYIAPKCGGRIILRLTDYKKFFDSDKIEYREQQKEIIKSNILMINLLYIQFMI